MVDNRYLVFLFKLIYFLLTFKGEIAGQPFLFFRFAMDIFEQILSIFSEELVGEARFLVIFKFAETVHIELSDGDCTWRMKLSYLRWRKCRGSTWLTKALVSLMLKLVPSGFQAMI
jgi:hypothetical protein